MRFCDFNAQGLMTQVSNTIWKKISEKGNKGKAGYQSQWFPAPVIMVSGSTYSCFEIGTLAKYVFVMLKHKGL